ncbi:MAG TPA: multicopper oxidase [Bryobacteraceae bacterium]|jgi:spore coat protein A|nr:multicopper oxidase [Bryobacteraceae bacterium]
MRPLTRRGFLYASLTNAALLAQGVKSPGAVLNPGRLAKFVDRLPIPPRAVSSGGAATAHYRLAMRQVESKIHRDLPPARLWGFGATSPGPTIEARKGQPVTVEWVNELPRRHFLPVDRALHGLSGTAAPDVRTVVHLHGGRVPPESDGYPEHWFEPGGSSVVLYPNDQEATLLWYHDHAMAITRLNIMAGLFGLYVIRDEVEDALHLPSGEYEIPLILFDRNITEDGQIHYPVSGNPARIWVPEFFGDAILANGKLFSYHDVEPGQYRLRILNASNSRTYYLTLSAGARSTPHPFFQIGSDQGLLAAPVELTRLTLAPAERADVIVDFQELRGQNILMQSDATPILQFRVGTAPGARAFALPQRLREIVRTSESEAARTRPLTLDDPSDSDDPTSMMMPMLLNGAMWSAPVTENPTLGSTEIWSLINLTDDSHPIHLHLVRFQILDRRAFDVFTYMNTRRIRYTAGAVPPDSNEMGWKDTVRAYPGMVTRIIVRFEGYAGRYVWHCHVLEHEDYEMMRPYDVLPANGQHDA